MAVDPQVALERYRAGIRAGAARYREGVQNSKPWAEAYQAAAAKMERNWQRAIAAGRHVQGARNLGTANWRTITTSKADRFASASEIAAAGYQQVVATVIQAATAAEQAAAGIDPSVPGAWLQKMEAAVRATARTWGRELD